MPGLNGTGPNGEGPFTGRGLGYCVEKQEDMDMAYGKKDGSGKGVGRAGGGRRNKNTGGCKKGGPGGGRGGGRGRGTGRKG